MKIGMIGCGKLGLPVALAIESRGHQVVGYDTNIEVAKYLRKRRIPYREQGLQPLLNDTDMKMKHSIVDLVAESDLIFVAVQTPHAPEYEGSTRLPDTRRDFDYQYLINAINNIAAVCETSRAKKTVAVISTCLPGTFKREIEPLLNEYISYVYTPQFIAMGTVLNDYLNPEFNLIGVHDPEAAALLEEFYGTINRAPNVVTDITTAEAIKVSYNTFITMKTVLANTWGELAHKTGANADDILKAWSISTKRLLSPKYLRAGVGDGGGCHPRDNIALSHIAQQVGLSHNIFEDLMKAREDHMAWIADECLKHGNQITVLGKAFKPETDIETGSPAILVANILREKGADVLHVVSLSEGSEYHPVVLVATQHPEYVNYRFDHGVTVIDPFGYIPDQEGVTVIRLGR